MGTRWQFFKAAPKVSFCVSLAAAMASATIRSSISPRSAKTFAELTAEEKARYSHRGAAFRQFLQWEDESVERHPHTGS